MPKKLNLASKAEEPATKTRKMELQNCPLFEQEPESAKKKEGNSLSQGLAKCSLFGAISRTIVTIDEIRLGDSANFYLMGRVTRKTVIRTWNNGKTRGRSFSIDVMDATGEIGLTVFNDKIDEIFDLVDVNKVVEIKGFRVKSADPKYQGIPNQTLELILSQTGSIEISDAEVVDIIFDFKDIKLINSQEVGSILDFVGIVYSEDGLIEGISKNGREYQYRVVHVTDKTKFIYDIKLWGQLALDFDLDSPKPVVLRRAKLEEHDGVKSLTVTQNTSMLIDFDISEAKDMLSWFQETRSK